MTNTRATVDLDHVLNSDSNTDTNTDTNNDINSDTIRYSLVASSDMATNNGQDTRR